MPNPSAMILPMAIPDWARGREIEQDEYGLWCAFCPDIETHAWINCPVAKIVSDPWPPHYQFERVPLREAWSYGDPVGVPLSIREGGRYDEVQKRSVHYRADWGGIDDDVQWQPADTMPTWAVRRWLLVRTVEARRVESISDEEWKLTGLARHGAGQWVWFISGESLNNSCEAKEVGSE